MGNALDRDLREGEEVVTHRLGRFTCRSGAGMSAGIADGSRIYGHWADDGEPGMIDGVMDIDVDATDRAPRFPHLPSAPPRRSPYRAPSVERRRPMVDPRPNGARA